MTIARHSGAGRGAEAPSGISPRPESMGATKGRGPRAAETAMAARCRAIRPTTTQKTKMVDVGDGAGVVEGKEPGQGAGLEVRSMSMAKRPRLT